jgi:hypothetical protein
MALTTPRHCVKVALNSGGLMRKSLLTIGIIAAAIAFSATAAAQATLETLMTHSISTTVGTHAGTALANATNALANRVANQTSATTGRTVVVPRQTVSASRRAAARQTQGQAALATTTAPASSGNGSLIASIQGGEKPQTVSGCAAVATAPDAKGANQNCAAPISTGDAHPSVVNLPAPQ